MCTYSRRKRKGFDFVFLSFFLGERRTYAYEEKLTPPLRRVSAFRRFLYEYPPANRCLLSCPWVFQRLLKHKHKHRETHSGPARYKRPTGQAPLTSIDSVPSIRPSISARLSKFIHRPFAIFIFKLRAQIPFFIYIFLFNSGGLVQSKRFQKFFVSIRHRSFSRAQWLASSSQRPSSSRPVSPLFLFFSLLFKSQSF